MIDQLIARLQEFFGITRKEARGSLFLLVLLFVFIWTPFIFRRWILPHFPLTTTDQTTQHQKLDSIVAEMNKTKTTTFDEDSYTNTEGTLKPNRTIRLFPFDPNVASVSDLTELGIPLFLAKRIDKYRSKGGKFRKKEDLLHIYDFPTETFKTLEPYIQLTASTHQTYRDTAQFKSQYQNSNLGFPPRETAHKKPGITPFDINTTDTTQLVKLRGIGSKLSLRILKFRNGLGGFHSTSQFEEIYGLDSLAVSELNKYARIGSPVKKININTATVEELNNHSYLRNKKWATIIVNYRTQHGNYTSPEDLMKIKVLDASTVAKLTPYLAF